jgi:hypothetical protein
MKLSLFLVFLSGAAGAADPTGPVLNREPLKPVPYAALPLGSVKSTGWLHHMLELQKDGLTGHADELLDAAGPNSAWKGVKGEDWEKGPYYAKGLVALAWSLDDADLKKKAMTWIEPILSSQEDSGFYGPPSNHDWWPRMVTNYLLRDYYEASGDVRVLPFLVKYYRYQLDHLDAEPLKEWGKSRAGDDIDTIFWLYNRTGEKFLLEVADKLERQAYPWTDIFTHDRFNEFGDDYQPKHAVNIPQAMKMPPVYWQRSGSDADRNAYDIGVAHLAQEHGLAMGINSGTEFLSGPSTTQGVELCSTVERMLSDETAIRILGEAKIGDDLEKVAFNALPGALSPDIHQHVYYCLPNQVISKTGHKGYGQDYDNGTIPSPLSGFPCCCYNFHMGWPKLVQNSWAATADGGLAQIVIAPVEVATTISGKPVKLSVTTDYPFDDVVRIKVMPATDLTFPISVRIPGWCDDAAVAVAGQMQPKPAAGTFLRIERKWSLGDEIVMKLPMNIRIQKGVNATATVGRGPLVYVLGIGEKRVPVGQAKKPGFGAYELEPTTPFNYALSIDPKKPDASFRLKQGKMNDAPFARETTPVTLLVKARKLESWKMDPRGLVASEPPVSPAASNAPEETLTLVPFGAGMLRVSNFPVLGSAPPPEHSFSDHFVKGDSEGWITYGGSWFVKDGALNAVTWQGSRAIETSTNFSDLNYQATIKVSDSGDAGLVFRVTDSGIGPDAYRGYYAGVSAQRQELILGKADFGWHPLKTVPLAVSASEAQTLRVEAKGDVIRVFANGSEKPQIEIKDGSFKQGSIGLRRYADGKDKKSAEFSGLTVGTL